MSTCAFTSIPRPDQIFLLQSPPSCMSKPLLIPESKEDHQWRLGGLLQRVNGKDMPSPGAAGEGVAQTQVGRNCLHLLFSVSQTHVVTSFVLYIQCIECPQF